MFPKIIGFSIINHPFWGTPIFGHTHIYIYIIADLLYFILYIRTICNIYDLYIIYNVFIYDIYNIYIYNISHI